ncbi:branched-chain amino acid ABC transporter permease [Hydrogenophaga aromaticivorans]|jgi:branched-chain amino acid transport system permease protein|uniref:Branched-chain amino acid ABC transporter permease n=1 Tax=Hydrogenophaga aromaticivorans TaxID=2610898 RepID=A0A7Y8KXN2_9BURK|nr:branched-chain amino acid ABC transporter permease [Hydrogenophaga aromaticivorans]MBQ0918345.1 branched-chain amino acid ABC transporter permease [Hydrogenophaga aromaticivorans]NWF46214.1 branched-chain amino acid ABC transporter permease [Hydrogenophaga aromaticivorans]
MSIMLIGLSIGTLLFLLAAGLTLVFGVLGVINFAHGGYFMLGAYLAYQSIETFGSLWAGLPVVILVAGALGAVQELLTLRPIYRLPHAFQLLSTFGVALCIEAAVRLVWGYDQKPVNAPPLLANAVELFGINVSSYRLFIIVFGIVVCVLLFLWIERTRTGLVVRAASTNSDMVACMGFNVNRLRTAVVAGSAALAGLGGLIAAPLFPVHLGMGKSIIIDCFIVVILGGLGNITGAIAAALMLGLFQAFGQNYFPDWVQVGVLVLVLVALMLRPAGLFSQKERVA